MAGANPDVENTQESKPEGEKETTNENKDATDIPQECLMKHPLQHTWCLWYYENDRNKKWEENQTEITSFSTVEDFWSVYNYIKLASEIRVGTDYSLFKKDIRPMWEDEANKLGGKWIISLNKPQRNTELDRLWLDVLLCLIGEAFENSDEVCGAVVNIRNKGDKICIWTGDATNRTAVMEIGAKLKERLHLGSKTQIHYQLHKDTMIKSSSSVKSAYVL